MPRLSSCSTNDDQTAFPCARRQALQCVMTDKIQKLIELFAGYSQDPSTLMELHQMTLYGRESWPAARDLFHRVRKKRNLASSQGRHLLVAQYCFEEVCAKTLSNFSDDPGAFDLDSPYYIVPHALYLAHCLGVDIVEVVRIVAPGAADPTWSRPAENH
jgi:hypothetical protein